MHTPLGDERENIEDSGSDKTMKFARQPISKTLRRTSQIRFFISSTESRNPFLLFDTNEWMKNFLSLLYVFAIPFSSLVFGIHSKFMMGFPKNFLCCVLRLCLYMSNVLPEALLTLCAELNMPTYAALTFVGVLFPLGRCFSVWWQAASKET